MPSQLSHKFAFAVFAIILALAPQFASAAGCPDSRRAVVETLSQWRSQDRYIDGGTLREEAELYIKPSTRNQLADCSLKQVLSQLKKKDLIEKWQLTVADAENILKIRKITQLTRQSRRPFVNIGAAVHGFQNEIQGLSQNDLDKLLADAQMANPSADDLAKAPLSKVQFNYLVHKLKRMALKSGNDTALDNDLYAFTVAATFFNLGWHNTKQAVFENSTRGAEPYTFMVAAGQDQVLDLLENLRFTKWDIEVIKKYVEAKMYVDPKFWGWLANWHFEGTVRAVPVGSVVFAQSPILQVIADPASAIIVESLINPWMSSMTNLATTASRNRLAAGFIKTITDAGTRRLVTGQFSALTALMAGADGTSNVLMAELTKSPAYGTMSHAYIGAFPTEFEALETFARFNKKPALMLPDTYDLLTGVRTAVRAAGSKLATVRQDSNIVNADGTALSTTETVAEIRKTWSALGNGHWAGVVTNDLTEKSLYDLARSGSDVEVVSVGGAFATSSVGVAHGNFVYKLIEMRDLPTGAVRFPIKISNGVKSTKPGEKDLYRVINNKTGLASYDLETKAGTPPELGIGETAIPLISTAFANGRRVHPRQTVQATAQLTTTELAQLAPELLDLKQTRTSLGAQNYVVKSSNELKAIKQQAIAAVTPEKKTRILVFPGSFFPVTDDGHIASVRLVNELFKTKTSPEGFDKIIFVPTGDHPVHGRTYTLSAASRIEQLRRHMRNLPRAEVSFIEVNNGGGTTVDTLDEIQRENPNAELITLMGEDVFWSIGRKSAKWAGAEKLLLNHHLVVRRRVGDHQTDEADTRALLQSLHFVERANGFARIDSTVSPNESPKQSIEFLNAPSAKQATATSVRAFYDQQNFSALVHATDPQWTFAMRDKDPHGDQTANGTLAVVGTELTIPNVVGLIREVLNSQIMKFSISGDSHFMTEVNDPTNQEFHAPRNFPQHGMKGRPGADGDRFISEVEELLATRNVVKIPAHEEKIVGGKTELVIAPYDFKSISADVADIKSILQFEKNGENSYSVTVNPRYDEYLNAVDPYKVLPHFHFGWCTDFCDYWVMKHELEQGHNVIFIVDAAAGVGAKTTGRAMRELLDLGLKVMSTAEFHRLNARWTLTKSKWSDVLNDLADWEPNSPTMGLVREELKKSRYNNPEHPGDLGESCAVFLK